MGDVRAALNTEISGAAFRRLLTTGTATPIVDIASDLDRPEQEIGAAVEALRGMGGIRVDEKGRIVGAAGLSVGPDRHSIEFGAHTFWTWCAYDILGIFGALQADGTAHSASPHSGESLEIHFRQGRPELTSLVLFRPDDGYMSCCANVYEDWCPNSNFFESREAASAWAAARSLPGRVLDLAEAADLATRTWEPLAGGLRM
jgi:alkylmercury lyase